MPHIETILLHGDYDTDAYAGPVGDETEKALALVDEASWDWSRVQAESKEAREHAKIYGYEPMVFASDAELAAEILNWIDPK